MRTFLLTILTYAVAFVFFILGALMFYGTSMRNGFDSLLYFYLIAYQIIVVIAGICLVIYGNKTKQTVIIALGLGMEHGIGLGFWVFLNYPNVIKAIGLFTVNHIKF